MRYTLSTDKILEYAKSKLVLPEKVKQKFVTVLVANCFAEPEFPERYFDIELPNGELLIIDRLEKDIIFEVAFSKTGMQSIYTGWEFLWLREAGEILKQEINEREQ